MLERWAILGAGNLVYDIIDAINSNEDVISCIVLNREINVNLEEYTKISLKKFDPDGYNCIFGYLDPNKEEFLRKIPVLRNLLHKRSYAAGFMGVGNYCGPHSTIAPESLIGNYNFFNRNCSVGHHTKIANFNHIGPGATVCGRCDIGSNVYVGAGSTIIDGITICDNVVIGAGALVTKDILEPGTYIGLPAKKKNPL